MHFREVLMGREMERNRGNVRLSTLKEQGDDPSLYVVPDALVEMVANHLRSGESYERRVLTGSLAGTTFDGVEFDEAFFNSVNLSKSELRRVQLRKVRADKCDLANANWTNATFESVRWQKCRATGLQLVDANCLDVIFASCKFDLAAFHGSKFRSCRWEKCDLREANFEGVKLIDVTFRDCDLQAARFPNASLKNIDLRGSHLAGVTIDPGKLRGTRVEPRQLPDLADLVGLIVEPNGD
jgi:uncharacterized protein YjbI with pentapeptide repeats